MGCVNSFDFLAGFNVKPDKLSVDLFIIGLPLCKQLITFKSLFAGIICMALKKSVRSFPEAVYKKLMIMLTFGKEPTAKRLQILRFRQIHKYSVDFYHLIQG